MMANLSPTPQKRKRKAGGQGKCGEDRPDAAAALGNLRVVADTNVTVRFVFRSRLQIRERLFT